MLGKPACRIETSKLNLFTLGADHMNGLLHQTACHSLSPERITYNGVINIYSLII